MNSKTTSYIAMKGIEACMGLSGAMLLVKNVFPKCDFIEKCVFLGGGFGVACIVSTEFEKWWNENCQKFGFDVPTKKVNE